MLRLSVRRSTILGDVKRAVSLIPQIKNNNAKADALLTVARAYLRNHDYDAAQKVLFQVTPLVPKNFHALFYTASLFAKSGNYAVSKRLFDRAKTMMVSYELLKAKEPSTEAQNISAFTRGLTNDLFLTPSERSFVISTNGGTGN